MPWSLPIYHVHVARLSEALKRTRSDLHNAVRREKRLRAEKAAAAERSAGALEAAVDSAVRQMGTRTLICDSTDWVRALLEQSCSACSACAGHSVHDITMVGMVAVVRLQCAQCRRIRTVESAGERTATGGYALNASYAGLTLLTGTNQRKLDDALSFLGLSKLPAASTAAELRTEALDKIVGAFQDTSFGVRQRMC